MCDRGVVGAWSAGLPLGCEGCTGGAQGPRGCKVRWVWDGMGGLPVSAVSTVLRALPWVRGVWRFMLLGGCRAAVWMGRYRAH